MQEKKPECPIAMTVSVVGTKWKIQIMRDLVNCKEKAMRFSGFKNNIEGISDKMLSQSLKELERDHLLNRLLVDDCPPRTEYSLTEMGASLSEVLSSLCDWGKQYQQMFKEEEKDL